MPEFLQELIKTAMETECEIRRLALSKIAASIINKWTNGKKPHYEKKREQVIYIVFVEQIITCVKTICDQSILPALHNSAENAKCTFVILVWVSG